MHHLKLYRFFPGGGDPGIPLQKLARFARWLTVCSSKTSLWVDMDAHVEFGPIQFSDFLN